jgi:hypothetical protein
MRPASIRTAGCFTVCSTTSCRNPDNISRCIGVASCIAAECFAEDSSICLTGSRHYPLPFRNRMLSNSGHVSLFRQSLTGTAIAIREMRRGKPTKKGGQVCYDTGSRQTPCAPFFSD